MGLHFHVIRRLWQKHHLSSIRLRCSHRHIGVRTGRVQHGNIPSITSPENSSAIFTIFTIRLVCHPQRYRRRDILHDNPPYFQALHRCPDCLNSEFQGSQFVFELQMGQVSCRLSCMVLLHVPHVAGIKSLNAVQFRCLRFRPQDIRLSQISIFNSKKSAPIAQLDCSSRVIAIKREGPVVRHRVIHRIAIIEVQRTGIPVIIILHCGRRITQQHQIACRCFPRA